MVLNEQKLKTALETISSITALYLFSTEEYLVRHYAEKALAQLTGEDAEFTRIDGPVPTIEEITMAAGTISFFTTRRVIYLCNTDLAAMAEKDVSALCDVIRSSENSVFVITTILKDEKAATTKKVKQLITAVEENGYAAQLAKPQPRDIRLFLNQCAAANEVAFAPKAADALQERCGDNMFLLENEIAKLAAACGYSEISAELVSKMGTHTVEADVFEMTNALLAKNTKRVFNKLQELLYLQNEPIAIAAAMSSSFIDVYRVKAAGAKGVSYQAVHKEMGYKGSDYRLKKAAENARGYTLLQLERILQILLKLDISMKSSGVNNELLLQAALGEILLITRR
ncbi:MAG: DNA polymerase III subunit delta [Oscillospiraceae bacterium]|nr:DNA polymerase III subunit delta [Oscillospiraceae bacterium]